MPVGAHENRSKNCPSDCPGICEIAVRDLVKPVSGIYRNRCPGFTEITVRDLLKSVSEI